MTNNDMGSPTISRTHKLIVEQDVVNLLFKLADMHGWDVKKALQGMSTAVDQMSDDPALIQAYKHRIEILSEGLK